MGWGNMMGWGSYGGAYGGGWPLLGVAHMLLWWVLIILGIVVLVRWLTADSRSRRSEDRSLAILRERYARGEIDKAEFDARRRDLAGT
jgi:putative membrane protein